MIEHFFCSIADNTYCIIRAEREKLRSAIVQNSQNPTWDLRGVFFRYDICKPIFIEVTAEAGCL